MHLSPPGGLGCWGGGSVVFDLLFIVIPFVGVCNCSMFCCILLYVHSSFAIISMGKRELVALLNLFSWCIVIVVWLVLAVPRVCLLWIIYVFLSCVCYAFVLICCFVLCGHLLGKGLPLSSRLRCLTVSLSLSNWYPGSGVVTDCIDS